MVPKGRKLHLLPEDASTQRGTPAACGAQPGQNGHWHKFGMDPEAWPQCEKCGDAILNGGRASAGEQPTAAVLCAHCGKPSDRGFIQCCRACGGLNG
jgi:hypothetical protein